MASKSSADRAQEAFEELKAQGNANGARMEALNKQGVGIPDMTMIANRLEVLINFTLGDLDAKNKRRVQFEKEWQKHAGGMIDRLEEQFRVAKLAGKVPGRQAASGLILPGSGQ